MTRPKVALSLDWRGGMKFKNSRGSQAIRLEGGTPGVSVAVESSEATEELLAGADYSVDGVAGVEWLLGEIARVIRETGPSDR